MKMKHIVIATLVLSYLIGTGWAKGGNGKGDGSIAVLTQAEADHLIFLREEEKLARDVYIALANQYGSSIFVNISASEQNHMDSVKGLLDKYGLVDPVVDDSPGVFTNTLIAGIYADLMARGVLSLTDALGVGVDIENMDIYDIEEVMLPEVIQDDIADVVRVLQNLLAGSYNHLDAFTKSL